jgi:integrase
VNATTKVYKAGKELTGEKWEFCSSHSFRVSAATNMAAAGASLTDIRFTLGHTSEAMSSRYIAAGRPNLSAKALAYFR